MKKLLAALVLMFGLLFIMIPTSLAAEKCKCATPVPSGGFTYEKEPNCHEKGIKVYTCKTCGGEYKEDAKPIEGKHVFPSSIPSNYNCEAGIKCTVSGCHAIQEGTKFDSHDWVEATCKNPKKCNRPGCKATQGSPRTKHVESDYSDETCTQPRKCRNCGEKYPGSQALGHTQEKAATCTDPAWCARCHAPYGQPLGHHYVDATCEKEKHCDNPGCTSKMGGPLGHDFYAATCTEPMRCSRKGCNATQGEKLGHNPSQATCETPSTCTRCGEWMDFQLFHKFGSWSTTREATCSVAGEQTRKCTRPGCKKTETKEIAKKAHTCSWVTTKNPTCTVAGIKSYKCTACGTVTKTDTIAKKAHTNVWKIKKDSTCTATGTKEYKCSVCGNVEKTETIAKKAHTCTWVTTKNPTCTATGSRAYKCTVCGTVTKTETIDKTTHSYKTISDITKPSGQRVVVKECTKCGNKITNVYSTTVKPY